MALGDKIKARRLEAHLSQEKVADLVGVSRQAVTKWESNQSAPNTENLFKLAEVLGTTVDFLLTSESESPSIAEQVYSMLKEDADKKETQRRNDQKKNLFTALTIAGGYLAIFLTGKLLFTDLSDKPLFSWLLSTDPTQHSYLFGWLLSSSLYLIASLISILPALFGKRRFSAATLAGFAAGLPLGEFLGENPSGNPLGHGHYGWAIWGGIFLLSCILGIVLQKYPREDISLRSRKFQIWLCAFFLAVVAVIVLIRTNMY